MLFKNGVHMLIRFRVQNFLSFNNEVELSLVAGRAQKHPEHIIKKSSNSDVDLLKSALIYGANASGKSNLIKAIKFAQRMVTTGVKAKDSIPRKPFKLDPLAISRPSRFEFEIKYNEHLYVYGFSLNSIKILEEWMLEILPSSEKLIYRRTTSDDGTADIKVGIKLAKKENDLLNFIALGTPQNRLFIQECNERNITHFSDVYDWFANVVVVIFPTSLHTLSPIGVKSETKFGDMLIEHLNKFNTGVCGYSLLQVPEPTREIPKELIEEVDKSLIEGKGGQTVFSPRGKRYFISKNNEELSVKKLQLKHRGKSCESDVLFDMEEESDGTLRLLDLIPILIPAKEGRTKVVIIDELDRSLHPMLSYEFIKEFLNSVGLGQIIVTTHESYLLDLDLLRRDEIWFVEKDQNGSSNVYSLEEFTPRYDKDIRKGYLLGRFGAIPVLGKPNWDEE